MTRITITTVVYAWTYQTKIAISERGIWREGRWKGGGGGGVEREGERERER